MKVSIIIRAFNAQKTIEKAIESALSQKFLKDQFEVIIINDGSTDQTGKILKKYERLPNIIVVNQENQGAIPTANGGFDISRGQYVVLLDSDDYFLPNFLSELSFFLDKNRRFDFVYPDYWEEFKDKRIKVSPSNIFETTAGGTLFRKRKLAEEKFYRKDILLAEYDLLLRTYQKWKGYHYKKPLFVYNRRTDSLSTNRKWFKKGIDQLKKLHSGRLNQISMIRSYSLD